MIWQPLIIFLELDGDALLGDGPKIIIAVVRDVVLECLEDRYTEDVGNTLLVEPTFNLAVHALPVCGSGTGVTMTVEIGVDLMNVCEEIWIHNLCEC